MLHKALVRVAIALTLATTALVVLEAPAAAATPRGPFYYAGLGSKRCIDNPNNNLRDNIRMDIWNCVANADNELWREIPTSDGFVEIKNVKSGKCLTVQNASLENNAAIIQYACTGTNNAQWRPSPAYDGSKWDYYFLENRRSGKCISVRNASVENGALLVQHECVFNGSDNNVWTWFTPADLPRFIRDYL